MTATILQKLLEPENENIKILYACESGGCYTCNNFALSFTKPVNTLPGRSLAKRNFVLKATKLSAYPPLPLAQYQHNDPKKWRIPATLP